MNEELTEQEIVKLVLNLLRNDEVNYTDDRLYGAAIMLDSYINKDLTLEDALNEFIENSGVDLKLEVKK